MLVGGLGICSLCHQYRNFFLSNEKAIWNFHYCSDFTGPISPVPLQERFCTPGEMTFHGFRGQKQGEENSLVDFSFLCAY